MFTMRRTMGWLMLVLSLGGCSTYRAATVPGLEAVTDPEAAKEAPPAIETGDYVRVILVDGAEFKGRILAVSTASFTLAPPESKDEEPAAETEDPRLARVRAQRDPVNYEPEVAAETVVVPFDHIRSVEKRGVHTGRTVLTVLGSLFGFVGILVALYGTEIQH